MARGQCIVLRDHRILMVQHRHRGRAWWCLPGGEIEPGESPAEATIRELWEECGVRGNVVRELSSFMNYRQETSHTFLVEIGEQTPVLGADPEFGSTEQILCDVRWMALSEISERDRAFVWSAGLIGLPEFMDEVLSWGEDVSYPGSEPIDC